MLGSYNTAKATLPHLLDSAAKHKTRQSPPPLPPPTHKTHTPRPRLPAPTTTNTSSTATPSGRILFVSATIHYTGNPLQSHVSVAKAGVDALSAALAIELGPRGLTSNVIAPGPIAGTEGMARLARSEDVAAAMKAVPVGRYGSVKDVADATVYLFSDAAGFVNGATVVGECSASSFVR